MKRVLVIEDDTDILEAIQLTLEMYGYEVKSSIRGDEGLRIANHYQPDLIILDYFLAGSNGAAICRTLKLAKSTKHIPVMMTSAHPAAHKVGIDHGADDFIAKPFSVTELMEKVSQRLNLPPLLRNGGGGGGDRNHCS